MADKSVPSFTTHPEAITRHRDDGSREYWGLHDILCPAGMSKPDCPIQDLPSWLPQAALFAGADVRFIAGRIAGLYNKATKIEWSPDEYLSWLYSGLSSANSPRFHLD